MSDSAAGTVSVQGILPDGVPVIVVRTGARGVKGQRPGLHSDSLAVFIGSDRDAAYLGRFWARDLWVHQATTGFGFNEILFGGESHVRVSEELIVVARSDVGEVTFMDRSGNVRRSRAITVEPRWPSRADITALRSKRIEESTRAIRRVDDDIGLIGVEDLISARMAAWTETPVSGHPQIFSAIEPDGAGGFWMQASRRDDSPRRWIHLDSDFPRSLRTS